MNISNILQGFLTWAWTLITGLQEGIEWLFTRNETLSNFATLLTGETVNLAPIYLIGGGVFVIVLIAGIIRAIV